MLKKTINVDDIGVVELRKRNYQKSIRIRLSDNKVVVTQPTWLPFKAGESFLLSKLNWVKSHTRPRYMYKDGLQVGFRTIKVIKVDIPDYFQIKTSKNFIEIYLDESQKIKDDSLQKKIDKHIVKQLRADAEYYLPQRTSRLADMFGFDYRSLSIKNLKRRWGSCNSRGDLVFNLNLMRLDQLHIDYVILHELTHTVHMNHGAEFWQHLESVFPNAKKIAKTVRHIDNYH